MLKVVILSVVAGHVLWTLKGNWQLLNLGVYHWGTCMIEFYIEDSNVWIIDPLER